MEGEKNCSLKLKKGVVYIAPSSYQCKSKLARYTCVVIMWRYFGLFCTFLGGFLKISLPIWR